MFSGPNKIPTGCHCGTVESAFHQNTTISFCPPKVLSARQPVEVTGTRRVPRKRILIGPSYPAFIQLSRPYPALIQSLSIPHPALIQPLSNPYAPLIHALSNRHPIPYPAFIQLTSPYPALIHPLSSPYPALIQPLSTPYPPLIQPLLQPSPNLYIQSLSSLHPLSSP